MTTTIRCCQIDGMFGLAIGLYTQMEIRPLGISHIIAYAKRFSSQSDCHPWFCVSWVVAEIGRPKSFIDSIEQTVKCSGTKSFDYRSNQYVWFSGHSFVVAHHSAAFLVASNLGTRIPFPPLQFRLTIVYHFCPLASPAFSTDKLCNLLATVQASRSSFPYQEWHRTQAELAAGNISNLLVRIVIYIIYVFIRIRLLIHTHTPQPPCGVLESVAWPHVQRGAHQARKYLTQTLRIVLCTYHRSHWMAMLFYAPLPPPNTPKLNHESVQTCSPHSAPMNTHTHSHIHPNTYQNICMLNN